MKKALILISLCSFLALPVLGADTDSSKADTTKVEVTSQKVDTATKAEATAQKAEKKAEKAGAKATKLAAKKDNVVTTKSGLKYIDEKVGTGAEAVNGATVAVHYTGWLYVNGKKDKQFDSSVDRGQPIEFPLGVHKVIAGWDEGLLGMKEGGKRTLIIPPDLAYGSRDVGNGLIPPNSTLIFDCELVKVTK